MEPTESPKAFVSHSTEDKERFVKDFAAKLRDNGIEAWYDEWEIAPGDNIVDKVFAGIKNANVFVIVLSPASIDKPWVMEELSVAVIAKIKAGMKIIPVLIEKCEVPTALHATLYVRIDNLASYDKELKRIVDAIYGLSKKPPLGTPPPLTRIPAVRIDDLTHQDIQVFRAIGDEYMATENYMVTPERVLEAVGPLGLSDSNVEESFKILGARHLLKVSGYVGDQNAYVTIEHYGFLRYAREFIVDFEEIYAKVTRDIVNNEPRDSAAIIGSTGVKALLVLEILDDLATKRLITIPNRTNTRQYVSIREVSPDLKRSLQ